MLRVYSPVPIGAKVAEMEPQPLPRSLRGVKLGIMNNQKPNATELLANIESRVREQVASVRTRFKPAQGAAALDAIDELVGTTDMVILASGD